MAKSEVILTHNIVGLGGESDHVKVAAGYARNYLLPQGLAIPLTGANKRRLEALRRRRAEREAHDLNSMTELAASLSKITIKIGVKTGADGKMFGSVTAGTIADELKHQCDITLDKRKVHLELPIRSLGDHEVELRLHADVLTKVKVVIESTTPVEIPVVPSPSDRGGDGRGDRGGRDYRGRGHREAPAPITDKAAPAKETKERKPAEKKK